MASLATDARTIDARTITRRSCKKPGPAIAARLGESCAIDQAVNRYYPSIEQKVHSIQGASMPGQKAAEATRR
ncbi:MAG: hypothetical protein ACRD1T_12870, partial [Acidimicrobiia bacterium]